MSIDNTVMQNIVGSNKIMIDFNKININDNALYTALYQHIKAIADKHSSSAILNNSGISGTTLNDVLNYLNNTNNSHFSGASNRHKASAIDDDSTLNTDTVKSALELLKSLIEQHENSTTAHEALAILFDSTNIPEITAGDVQNAISEVNARLGNIIAGGDSNAEVVDARNSVVWGIIFNTLKARLDYTEKEVMQNEERLSHLEYMTLKNDFTVPLATDDEVLTLLVDDDDTVILADWKYQQL